LQRFIDSWYSPSLEKEMPIATYGHYGFALLMIPTAAADYLEYERFQLLDSISWFINSGKVKVFSIDSMNNQSWMNPSLIGKQQIVRHQQWNNYVTNEVVPYIRNATNPATPIFICGASFGAFHSMNLFMKRPDLFEGVIAMSGVYDLTAYTRGYFDEDVYFNSPIHFIPQLNDTTILSQLRVCTHIHIMSGAGSHEDPEAGARFATILQQKGIRGDFDNWGPEWPHDWHTWRSMLPHCLGTHF